MARKQSPIMLIYPEDKDFLRHSTMSYENIETGGDLFGLWKNENEVVVQLVTGPGENCRRTPTAFFQDATYLKNVGEFLTSAKGLCNIGEWHSHHRLNLPEPSGGDKATVWRNMPNCGLKRFLLIIATITREGQVNMNGFMFTAPENGSSTGGMRRVETRVLTGPNPFRSLPDVQAKLDDGVERRLGQEAPSSSKFVQPSSAFPHDDNASSFQKENQPSKQQRLGHNPFQMFQNKTNPPPYRPLSNNGGASGNFPTRNDEQTYLHKRATLQHVSEQPNDGRRHHAPSSPKYQTMSSSYQMCTNL